MSAHECSKTSDISYMYTMCVTGNVPGGCIACMHMSDISDVFAMATICLHPALSHGPSVGVQCSFCEVKVMHMWTEESNYWRTNVEYNALLCWLHI